MWITLNHDIFLFSSEPLPRHDLVGENFYFHILWLLLTLWIPSVQICTEKQVPSWTKFALFSNHVINICVTSLKTDDVTTSLKVDDVTNELNLVPYSTFKNRLYTRFVHLGPGSYYRIAQSSEDIEWHFWFFLFVFLYQKETFGDPS